MITYETLVLMKELNISLHDENVKFSTTFKKVDKEVMIDVSLVNEEFYSHLFKVMRLEHFEEVYLQLKEKLRKGSRLRREFLTYRFLTQ